MCSEILAPITDLLVPEAGVAHGRIEGPDLPGPVPGLDLGGNPLARDDEDDPRFLGHCCR